MIKYALYTAVPSLLVLITLIWLIVALIRKSPSRKLVGSVFGVEVLILLVLYFYYLSPREYPRNYLTQSIAESPTLAELATEKGFFIGAAINKSSNPAYSRMVPKEYNSITPENATKWRQMLANGVMGEYDFTEADAIVDHAVADGVRVRGHTLVWGKFSGRTYPKELDARVNDAADPAAELRQVMRDHITEVLTHFRGRIKVWDAVNEPMSMDGPYLDKNIYLNTLGRGYVAEAFRIAHEVDPTLQLFLNEQFGNYTGEGVEVFFELLQELVEADVPIHGVGVQAHNIFKTHDLDEFRQFTDRVADLGLLLEITEFDARIRLFEDEVDPYQAQGEYTAAYAAACIVNPACIGFTAWGLSDASTWFDFVPPFTWMRPNDPLLFDTELRPKPAYDGIRKALSIRR
jgi:endo-1,4-beta-xylanase